LEKTRDLQSEANSLITESQELFAQRKTADAIQLLRKAYELDKSNSLARSILANALVEHAQSIVETDWLEAEKLTNQALALNPAHPTAKTILNLIVERKTSSSVDDWVAQASKLQSSGDLFGALAWVAEGLAVHPHDSKLLQIQDAIQRDQEARRRQARRGDLDDLRRMQREIDGTTDVAAKQALAARIQAVAAKHWTDGEILSIANALLLKLGLVSKDSPGKSPRGKNSTVILHVPRPTVPEAPSAQTTPAAPSPQPSAVAASQVLPSPSPSPAQTIPVAPSLPPIDIAPVPAPPTPDPQPPVPPPTATPVPSVTVPTAIHPTAKFSPPPTPFRTPPRGKVRRTPQEPQPILPQIAEAPASAPGKSPSQPTQPARSHTTLIVISVAATILLVGATFFFTRKHYETQGSATPAPGTVATTAPNPAPPAATPTVQPPVASTPSVPAPEQPSPQQSTTPAVSEPIATAATPVDQTPVESRPTLGSLLVMAGQDGATVSLNGKALRQLTQAGQLRVPNLDLKDYVVQVSKNGFQDPPQQRIRIRKGEQTMLIFKLQPQPTLAALTIQGGSPGTAVLVDQTPVGTIQPDGSLSVSTVSPGDHTVELRKDRFKPRQFKKHFVAGSAVSLVAADAALETAPAELKITFTPADARVAIVKGDLLKMVSSGVPLNLPPGTYTLTARTADRFTRSSTIEIVAGQPKTLDLSLAPNGMSKFDDPSAWKQEGTSFTRKGGDFALYGDVPTAGTFSFSAMLTKGRTLQWVLNYTDARNYILFQIDDTNFYRSIIRNGNKSDEIIVPHKGDKKSFRTLQIRVTPTEIDHQIKNGDTWTVLDRWTQSGVNLSQGKFGFYVPGSDQIAVSTFVHYADLNIH
jgi:hypothetical protein